MTKHSEKHKTLCKEACKPAFNLCKSEILEIYRRSGAYMARRKKKKKLAGKIFIVAAK